MPCSPCWASCGVGIGKWNLPVKSEQLDIEILERLCIMTIEGMSDEDALFKMGLQGTAYERWLNEHPVKGE